MFSYGYLGFELGPDNETIYYLTGGPIYVEGERTEGGEELATYAKGVENLHLVTYNITNHEYNDHGPIFLEDGSRPTIVNSIAVGNSMIYSLAQFEHNGKTIRDLIKIPNPH